ncbi:MAG: 5-amino-6-(D-ribitylamino)uracil--L-tyrosine 4-hydroxyphenyl transferase CofH [Candidatus Thiodiazotropha sp. (ex Lucinoma borealis)]|nr:5-amino-6-(D-ribitylamino)uracil--L-tyrosine 4-hydroxyphenyl transferase CofH [Candidatus Thiodiazotropha sp. (ex Lucinoma borealis)]
MTTNATAIVTKALQGAVLADEEALLLSDYQDLGQLVQAAAAIRDRGHGSLVTYSPKVFIPLTKLCRDSCHYCTFAELPKHSKHVYLQPDEVLEIAERGIQAGCHEALFTLGDKPELRYRSAANELNSLGHHTTISYLAEIAQKVFEQTGLLPHLNAGVMDKSDLQQLRGVSVSQGLMLESSSLRLLEPGAPHYGSPDKVPARRLKTIEIAGDLGIPFTSGILVGIGETRRERIESLLALKSLAESKGHLQEIIIQNFRRKPDTKMAHAPEPDLGDLLWTIAIARLIFGPKANIQAPPNLSPGSLGELLAAGINDWGGVSPVTSDHVNPEAPWPQRQMLAQVTEAQGKLLQPRLPLYPEYAMGMSEWVDVKFHQALSRRIDGSGFPRTDDWFAGANEPIPKHALRPAGGYRSLSSKVYRTAMQAANGKRLDESEITTLFEARGRDQEIVCAIADELRESTVGNRVSYVVTRNINYTNVCGFRCGFCAFSKCRANNEPTYDLSLTEIQTHVNDAWQRGAVEVCLQGGIHPRYTGATYLRICQAIKAVQPNIHIHAFSPLEVRQGARTLGISAKHMLTELKAAGLASLPGTAAEILDDEVRDIICHDKLNTEQWLEIMKVAHSLGLNSTATIMFGHVDRPVHWARHLLRIRDLQAETGGFTEFVPLPFVHMGAPIYRRGESRQGPTFREALLMHAMARLVLYPHITNIQTSWAKMGREGALSCLQAGANDLGGTLMSESISRAAGASHGQELPPEEMERLIASINRPARQRTTLYGTVDPERISASRVVQVPELVTMGQPYAL